MKYEGFDDEPQSGDRRDKMGQEYSRINNLVDTTDCLEAISTIKTWKNFLFIIILLGLLFLQGSFLMVNFKWAKSDEAIAAPPAQNKTPVVAEANQPASAAEKVRQPAGQAADTNIAAGPNTPAEPNAQKAKQAAEPNQPPADEQNIWFQPTVKLITLVVRFVDFVLIPATALYCLTMLFALKVSLISRLGGINHIARAFFLSGLFAVLLMPWQLLFAPLFTGAMFTSADMLSSCQATKSQAALVPFYLRFTGYWVLVVALLLAAQIRSIRWAKATLRRLEVV